MGTPEWTKHTLTVHKAETKEVEEKTLDELLDEGGLTGDLSATVFSDSPVQNREMEAAILREILIKAHRTHKSISETYILPSAYDAEYINRCHHQFFIYDGISNRMYPSEALAKWMTETLRDRWTYSPTR
jgi:sulfur carrier protein ThiS